MIYPSDSPARGLGKITQWARDTEAMWSADAFAEEIWFRGHGDADWSLTPGFLRPGVLDEICGDELSVFLTWQQHAKPNTPARTSTKWDYYFLAQHYRLPTRLLDWTRGALTATYFALSSEFEQPKYTYGRVRALSDRRVLRYFAEERPGETPPIEAQDPSSDVETAALAKMQEGLDEGNAARIWMLDASSLNKYSINCAEVIVPEVTSDKKWLEAWLPGQVSRVTPVKAFDEDADNSAPLALYPPQFDKRMSVQQATFTCHGSVQLGLDEIAKDNDTIRLAYLDIPPEWRVVVWHHLWLGGLTRETFFPELESTAHLLRRWMWSGGSKP